MFTTYIPYSIHLNSLTSKVNRNHCFSSICYSLFYTIWVNIVCLGIDVSKNRCSTAIQNTVDRGSKCDWCRNNLISKSNPRSKTNCVKSCCTICDKYSIFSPHRFTEFFLGLYYLGSTGKKIPFQNVYNSINIIIIYILVTISYLLFKNRLSTKYRKIFHVNTSVYYFIFLLNTGLTFPPINIPSRLS